MIPVDATRVRRSVRMEYEALNIDGETIRMHRYEGGTMAGVQVFDKAGKPVRSAALNRESVAALIALYSDVLKDWEA
jgi:hypothetical protein